MQHFNNNNLIFILHKTHVINDKMRITLIKMFFYANIKEKKFLINSSSLCQAVKNCQISLPVRYNSWALTIIP